MKNKILKDIVVLIASAQRHSDEGKIVRNQRRAQKARWFTDDETIQEEHQDVLSFKNTKSCYGYNGKDKAIMSAIKMIDSHKYMGVNYFIKLNDNSEAAIVYFNLKLDGKRYQVSFHSFSRELKKLAGKGSPCRWEKKVSSRETCQILLKLCGEESKIE